MSPNRLARSYSPYLRMHAEDPVDWRPWGEEAFAEARETDRPLLLSVGYSACHWCHVMQRESFRDAGVAAVLNERFIPVKVDRELRPDIDKVYLDYVTAANGSGGWPLNVFTSPDLLPFFGGTYFPPRAAGDTPGFRDVLDAVADAWERQDVEVTGALVRVREFLDRSAQAKVGDPIDESLLSFATGAILAGYDREHGGFGRAPKFPQLGALRFLIARYRGAGSPRLVEAVDHTLTAMLRGGIYDHAGGGIMRYATDDEWLVPHFEKMLYDNGSLLTALAGAAALPHADGSLRDEYAAAARGTARFLARDLEMPCGGFAAALSADALGVEGMTYVWGFEELAQALTPAELDLAQRRLGVTPDGNWHKHTILVRPGPRDAEDSAVDALLARLLELRAEHPQPDRDEKVLTGWNAIAARGLVEAGVVFGDDSMLSAGVALTRFMLESAVRSDGVTRVLCDEREQDLRLAEDAALLTAAVFTAFEATGDGALLHAARELHADSLDRFAEGPAVFMTLAENDLPVRPFDVTDDPVPSPGAVMAENAARLFAATGEEGYATWARSALRRHTPLTRAAPLMTGVALAAAVALDAAGSPTGGRDR